MSDLRSSQTRSLFYAYAPEDEALYKELVTHLRPLHREGLLTFFSKDNVEPGLDEEQNVDKELEAASFILLLLSSDFVASDYWNDHKLVRAIERHNAGETRVIPILLRPCNWQDTLFGKLQILPRNAEPIILSQNRDLAFSEVEQTLRTLLLGKSRSHPFLKNRAKTDQNRVNLLKRLQSMYEELLNDALHEAVWIDLGLSPQPGLVANAAKLLHGRPLQSTSQIGSGTSLYQIYQKNNQELLLLGAAGAGKSTLLYQLALDLLREVHLQPAHPLPILFSLSSWPEKHLPLETWMAEQLTTPIYEMPRKLSQQWVREEKILPLLDGLDEMKVEARPACIAAINAYRREHPLRPLVVCSRSDEYTAAATQEHLHLQSAIEVQPITPAQLDATFMRAGEPFAALRSELSVNLELHELALTPLWLTVLLLTFKDVSIGPLPSQRSELQQHLFQRYIERMVEQKGDAKRYPLEKTIHWLSWLAKQIQERNLPVLAVELLQPDWLGKKLYNFYLLSFILGAGLLGWLASSFGFAPFTRLGTALIIGLGLGFVKWLEKGRIKLAERITWSRKKTLRWGLTYALLCIVISWPLSILLSWSGTWPIYALIAGLMLSLMHGLLAGLSAEQYVERDSLSPGEGLLRALRNGVSIGLTAGLGIGLIPGLGIILLFWPEKGLLTGLSYGLIASLIFGFSFGMVFWLFFGLSPVIEHFQLRLWFWRMGHLPLHIGTFLEDANSRHLLQRIGGGYRFIHPLLQNHFASEDITPPHTP